jgi:Zn-dependent M28 family amino/carboxypeptidase
VRSAGTRIVSALAVGVAFGACVGASPVSTTSAGAGDTVAVDSSTADVQTQTPAARPAPAFDSARALEHLKRQVAFGPRPSGSAPLKATREYILAQLKAAGVATRQDAFVARTPAGEVSMANVVATIPGRRPDRIVLASHFDTKIARDFKFLGANDGASSTAALLELARVLQGQPRDFTIELLFLDGEEAVNWDWQGNDNTYGSRHYVDAAQKAGTLAGVKALVLLDMIGDRDLVIRRDSNSTPWLVDIVWAAAARAGHRATFSNELTTVEDDHVPFLRAGVPAVDIIDLDNPTWHTAQDDLEHVSARSLQIVGDVVLAALPDIERRLAGQR